MYKKKNKIIHKIIKIINVYIYIYYNYPVHSGIYHFYFFFDDILTLLKVFGKSL